MIKRGKGHNKRKPTALKILHGEKRPERLNLNEPKPIPIAPQCPDYLSESAKKEWAEMSPELERLGLLTKLDGQAFACLCQDMATMKELCALMAKTSPIVKGKKDGTWVQNPIYKQYAQTEFQVRSFLNEFGMTPSSRSKITVAKPEEEESPFKRLCNR